MRIPFKNLIIFTLIALAIFQTYTLWFINFSNSSQSVAHNTNTNKDSFIKPAYISHTLKEDINKYNLIYDINAENDFYINSKNLLIKYLEKGEESTDVIKDITNEVSFNYNFLLTNKNIHNALSIKSKTEIINFNKITFTFTKDNLYIVFSNNEVKQQIYCKDSNLIEIYKNSLLNQQSIASTKGYYYLKNKNDYILFFDETFEYNLLDTTNPYSSNGEIHISSVEKQISQFFDAPNSNIQQSIPTDTGAITFSNQSTIVRYYPNDVFEYKNYGSYMGKEFDLLNYYLTATSFIKNDASIKNNYYLDNYTVNTDSVTFRFNLTLGDFPIILSQTYKDEHMSSFIEVTITNNIVTTYKKIPYNFSISEYKNVVSVPITNILSDSDGTMDIELGYKMENKNNLYTSWFINFDNNQLVQSTIQ
ncbi:MAG: hypothetical protein ACK5LT_11495 [Lachnospirales bacterium]